MDWVTSHPWDGKDRTKAMINTIISPMDASLKGTLMVKWFIGAIAAAVRPNGVSSHGVLTFQGAQGLGKTMWFKRLAPCELDLVIDGQALRVDDKDSVFTTLTHWLVELGEVDATFRKSDVAALKSFLTKDKDIIRRPYEAEADEFPRQTVFFASVNQTEFLADSTGNRRFWVIPVNNIDYTHDIDMQQFWAQIYAMYKDGWPFYLDEADLNELNESNRDFGVFDMELDALQTCFDWSAPEALWKPMTMTEITETLQRRVSGLNMRRISSALTDKLNVKPSRSNGRLVRRLPPKFA